MGQFLFILCAAVLTASAVGFIANLPGVLIIPLAGWQAEISLALFLGIVALGLLLFYTLILFLRLLLIAPQEQWRGWFRGRRRTHQRRAEAGWVGALLILTEAADNQTALQAALAQAKRALPEAALTYLARAAAAPDPQTRQQIYHIMAGKKDSESRLLGLLGLMYSVRAQNEIATANDYAAQAKAHIAAQKDAHKYKEWLRHILPE